MAALAPSAVTAADAARVLIVDDSVVARAVIGRALDATGRYAVAGAVPDVATALRFLATSTVDFILLDIELPGVDGLTALPDLLLAGGTAKVVIVSSAAAEGARITVQALAFGAADTLVKPGSGPLSALFGATLIEKLNRLGEAPDSFPVASRSAREAPSRRAAAAGGGMAWDIVAIGASTGGIHALSQLLRALPVGFRVPVLITQHLPASFTPYFAAQLALLSGRPCDVAVDRLRIRPGRVIVAPGDAHMRCVPLADGGAAVRLSREPATSGCLPSVDPMLASVAATWGERALAIILSGMGRDGAAGAQLVREAGGTVVAQDRETSVVWGMPGAVAAAGMADALLPPDAIGRLIAAGRRP